MMTAKEAWDAWKAAKQRADLAREELATALLRERDEGASLSDLAARLGISRERVRKLTGDPDDRITYREVRQVSCPRCGAPPLELCRKTNSLNHAERYARRDAAAAGSLDDLTGAEMDAMAGGLLAE